MTSVPFACGFSCHAAPHDMAGMPLDNTLREMYGFPTFDFFSICVKLEIILAVHAGMEENYGKH